jgi:hypothetical protein
LIVVYLSNGRFHPPKDVPVFRIAAAEDVAERDETGDLAGGVAVSGLDEMAPKTIDASPAQVIALEDIPEGNSSIETLPAGNSSLISLSLSEIR